MLIRKAEIFDLEEVFSWRNDPQTRKMFFNNNKVNKKEHVIWFSNVLKSKETALYIGEINKKKIGVCRFDFKKELKISEVSINLNPSFRGKGLSEILLSKSINLYLQKKKIDILSQIKKNNLTSIKIFQNIGFLKKKICKNKLIFVLPKDKLIFSDVKKNKKSISILFDLLKKRKYSISHQTLPSKKEHENFVKKNPYIHWYILFFRERPVGSVYLKKNNSIGLNLIEIREEWLSQIIDFIKANFHHQEKKLSVVPEYFYFNISIKNKKLIKIFENLLIEPIQISFKI